jgi:DNA topoisomerase-3
MSANDDDDDSNSTFPVVLMVAEKPSIAATLALALAQSMDAAVHERGQAPCVVHVWRGVFEGVRCDFRVTCVLGHVYRTDFVAEADDEALDPALLFDMPVRKTADKAIVVRHLQNEARGAAALVLWLDCDREGENICFEVMDNVVPHLARSKTRFERAVYRARFSSLAAADLRVSFRTLGVPNENEARAVDARQEIDLKVGVAFTRFQTAHFLDKFANLNARLVSYGPCQTPTLGFCVQRRDEIHAFVAEPFWFLDAAFEHAARRIQVQWARERLFVRDMALVFLDLTRGVTHASVLSCVATPTRRARPIPLNTVELLKIASRQLGMSPKQAMQTAERLYTSGYISYPRTESSRYADGFELADMLQLHARHALWGEYVRSLLVAGPNRPRRDGVDAGDHPPITPTRAADETELRGADWRMYEYIARHFLATVSPDAEFEATTATFAVGGERFVCTGRRTTSPGFTLLMPWLVEGDQELPPLAGVKEVRIVDLALREGQTAPPDFLSESELISLMERNGIGTDASIASHIENIVERRYVELSQTGRRLVPTQLGAALVHGYLRIDPDQVLPTVRRNIERLIDLIAKGKTTFEVAVPHALALFRQKYDYFVSHIDVMDELFEATFRVRTAEKRSDGAGDGGGHVKRVRSRCGRCHRYMQLVATAPARMHCDTCESTYALPQQGAIKLYKGATCPLDDFELLLYSVLGGKSFPLCPACFNDPSIDEQEMHAGCNRCPHPSCEHAMTKSALYPCPECDFGTLVLDRSSAPKWRVDCNACLYRIELPPAAHRVHVAKATCGTCGAFKLAIDFSAKQTPLGDGETKYVGCLLCDALLNGLTHDVQASAPQASRGGRGRGRGRGGRGSRR